MYTMTDPTTVNEHHYDVVVDTKRKDVATQVNRNNDSLKQWTKKCLVVVIVSSVLITIVLSIIIIVFRTKIGHRELDLKTIQRRFDGTVDFYRFWNDYKTGFGNISGEHWLGNDYLHVTLGQKSYQVRFDLEDFDGNTAYATYKHIYVGDESTNYKLSLNGYSGTAGDAMVDRHGNPMNGMMFSTPDRDNDISVHNCNGVNEKSGWWHASCTYASINGSVYLEEYSEVSLHWKTWKITGLKKTKMMIKPLS